MRDKTSCVAVGTGLRFGEFTALWSQMSTWLRKSLPAKHEMRGHHLGTSEDDEVTSDGHHHAHWPARPWRADYYERVWYPLIAQLRKNGVAPFRFLDLRDTHVAWLVAKRSGRLH